MMTVDSFSDSTDAQPALVGAVEWVRDLLTGSVGVSIAVLAIACVGFALLQGRMPIRDGARTILGCFILFASPAIATAFAQLMNLERAGPSAETKPIAPPPVATPQKPPVFDPYAGASVPNN